MSTQTKIQRKTIRTFASKKQKGEPITMVTAYDATFARLIDESRIDGILVGDSLGNVIQGRETTLPVTLDEMIYHTRCVVRATQTAHVVADMPFLSYGTTTEDGVRNAGRLVKEGGAHAVKLEGGAEHAETIRRISDLGVPVMGHLGLTPQSIHKLGGYRVQGRGDAAEALLEDALALQEAGAYSLVLEMVPRTLAKRVSEALDIPTIGIGAGPDADGQILVCYDLLGLNEGFKPKFLRRYANLAVTVKDAMSRYIDDVGARTYPADEHSFDE